MTERHVKMNTEKLHAFMIQITLHQRVEIISYVNWDCEDVEYACEDCIDAYIVKCKKQHRKNKLNDDLSNLDEIFHCPCEEVIEICCNCKDSKCDRRIAGEPPQH